MDSRITYIHKGMAFIGVHGDGVRPIGNEYAMKLLDRLAAYEDTNLTPDEITAALSRLKEYDDAEREGRLARLPCKVGDECFEIDPGHGIVKHVVTGTTVYNRAADGKRYMTDFVNVITIDTWATDDHGGEWPDHYTPEEWANRILTRAEAAAAIEKGEGE